MVTWNTWGLPAPIAPRRQERLPRIARWLEESGVDIAGMQEVWRGAIRLLPRSMTPDQGADSGLALVTDHEVRGMRLHPFQAERGVDALKAKGLLEAEVWVDGGASVWVGVTHLQAGGGDRNAAVRRDQVEEILAVVSAVQGPALLMGDFNFYEDSALDEQSRLRLVGAGFEDVAAERGVTEGTYPGMHHRFDRIYARGGAVRCLGARSAEVLAMGDEPMSDHHAVRASVGLGTFR